MIDTEPYIPPLDLDIVTLGSALQDYLIDIPESLLTNSNIQIRLGEKVTLTDSPHMFIGGGGANTAVNFSNLGFKTAIISRIANDTAGYNIIRRLKHCQVNIHFLQISEKSETISTGSSFILNIKNHDRSALVNRGVSKDIEFNKIDYQELKNTKWVYISSLSNLDTEELKQFCEFCAKHKIHIAFNPGAAQQKCGVQGLASILQNTHILFLNKEEASQLLDFSTSSSWQDDILKMSLSLQSAGPCVVVITNGSKGSSVLYQDSLYFMPVYQVETVSTIGAGDAFASTFTANFMKNCTIPTCLKRASANAALVVTKIGANNGLGTEAEIDHFIAQQPNIQPFQQVLENAIKENK